MRRLRLRVLRRRQYFVPGPNSLWHIDGHHKLIRSVILADKQFIVLDVSLQLFYNKVVSFHVFATGGDLLSTVGWMDSVV